jgi:hypothetical protein
VTAAVTALGATDVLHFLGRKPHPAFAGEVTIDSRRRPEGCRVRFRLKRSSSTIMPTYSGLRQQSAGGAPLAGRRHGPAAAVVSDDQGRRQFLALR